LPSGFETASRLKPGVVAKSPFPGPFCSSGAGFELATLCPTSEGDLFHRTLALREQIEISARRPLPSAAATEANASNNAPFASRSLIYSNQF
jgi:hypothetical protein